MPIETGLSKNQILTELSKSPHGNLAEYVPVGSIAARQEPDFLAHLVAWDRTHGQIRDSKAALPVIALTNPNLDDELVSNALAHLAVLVPRQFLRAYRFAWELRIPARMRLRKLITNYLRAREANWTWWEKCAVQDRESMKELYSLGRVSRSEVIGSILWGGERGKAKVDYPRGSIFEVIANLKSMSAAEAAGTILERQIPFLVARGALGDKAKDPDLVLALINRMTPSQLVNNSKMLERLGVKTVPALRSAYEQALTKAAGSRQNTLKATLAVEAVEDEGLKDKLRALQEKQIKTMQQQMGLDGNWLVLGDKSGSMASAIETARHVAATLARLVKGKVWMCFFDTVPSGGREVTGMTYEDIKESTKRITAGGGTSIGCGLLWAIEKKVDIDGIAIVSDGGDNTAPYFHLMYAAYVQSTGKQPPVYLYHTPGDPNHLASFMASAGRDLQQFELGSTVDYYSLPNLVQTMRVNRYSLIDEIMDTPLLKLEDVLTPKERKVKVHA